MAKYRKKPVVIEAFKLRFDQPRPFATGPALPGDAPNWLHAAVGDGSVELKRGQDHEYLSISTLEGRMTADVGDYIIQGIKGELYPCKPDIFEATYVDASVRCTCVCQSAPRCINVVG